MIVSPVILLILLIEQIWIGIQRIGYKVLINYLTSASIVVIDNIAGVWKILNLINYTVKNICSLEELL